MKTLAFILFACAAPAFAAERGVTVTDFDRLRVDGGFIVEVRTGVAASARIIGSAAAIEATSVVVQGRQLTIRRNRQAWGGYPGQTPPAATIRITVRALSNVGVSGPATVSVDRMRGLKVAASLEGPGSLSIGALAADRMDIGTFGSGTMTLGGTVGNLTATVRGAGTFDATRLTVSDLKLNSESAGDVTVTVKRAADVTMTAAGRVTILGSPACTVRNIGSGTVACGSDQAERR